MSSEAVFVLQSVGIQARAVYQNNKLTVLAGSTARAEAVDSFRAHNYAKQREDLIAQGILKPQNGALVFTQDTAFNASSAAAAIVLGRTANGKIEWRLENDQTISFEQWRQRAGRSILEPIESTWQPFFSELAHKLLEFETHQHELVQVLENANIKVNLDDNQPLGALDPFSFFSLVLKHKNNALEKFAPIAQALGLQTPLPTDLHGVPSSNAMNAWFFAYRSEREDSDIPTLWALAKQALLGNVEPETFEAALKIRQVGLSKLTAGLFWLNPSAYLPLNPANIAYLEKLGLRQANLVKTLAEYTALLEQVAPLVPDFITLSTVAKDGTDEGKNSALLESEQFPYTAFCQDVGQFSEDLVKGNMLLDRKYGQLLLELLQSQTWHSFTPTRSPYTNKTQLAVRVGLSGKSENSSSAISSATLYLFDTRGGFEGIALEPGLSLVVGVADCQLNPSFLERLQNTSGLPTLPKVTIGNLGFGINDPRLADQLSSLPDNTTLRLIVHLSPHHLEQPEFLQHLDNALHYTDAVKQALDELLSAPPEPVPLAPSPKGRFVAPHGVPLNQILYGPPGTGKTHRSISEALRILEPEFYAQHKEDRAVCKAKYDQLATNGNITFVTFHQSFGYEDFVEGIKPVMQSGQLHYQLEDGLFLQAVRAAGGLEPAKSHSVDAKAHVWRIFIDGEAPSSVLRERCIERGEIRISSWLSGSLALDGRAPSVLKSPTDLNRLPEDQLNAQQWAFKESMRIGDLVCLASNANTVVAVGIVESEYRFDTSLPMFSSDYAHARAVRWLDKQLLWRVRDWLGQPFSLQPVQRLPQLSAQQVLEKLSDPPTEDQFLPHVLIIDEINRGNVAKILGDLITLLEPNKRSGEAEALTVRLPLSKRSLSVPPSLYIVATMNTADRSLTQLDAALRRRFGFVPLYPEPEVLSVLSINGDALDLPAFLSAINRRIEQRKSREYAIGHAYFMGIAPTIESLAEVLRHKIIPLLEEYFFEDWEAIRFVFADEPKPEGQAFIKKMESGGITRYEPDSAALTNIEAYVRVYSE